MPVWSSENSIYIHDFGKLGIFFNTAYIFLMKSNASLLQYSLWDVSHKHQNFISKTSTINVLTQY